MPLSVVDEDPVLHNSLLMDVAGLDMADKPVWGLAVRQVDHIEV